MRHQLDPHLEGPIHEHSDPGMRTLSGLHGWIGQEAAIDQTHGQIPNGPNPMLASLAFLMHQWGMGFPGKSRRIIVD